MSIIDYIRTLFRRQPPSLADVLDARIRDEIPVRLAYTKPEDHEPSLRIVSPYELVENKNGSTTLLAWDHSRSDIRTFRIDRIRQVAPAADLVAYRKAEEV